MASRTLLQTHQRVVGSLFSKSWEVVQNRAAPPRAQRFHKLTEVINSGHFHQRPVQERGRSRVLYAVSASSPDLSQSTAQAEGILVKAAKAENKSPKICILGGGFGGLYTAVKLDELLWPNGYRPEVTLIDQNDRFVFKPLLYDVLVGIAEETEVAPLFRDLLEPFQTRFIQGRVSGVEVSPEPERGGTVLLADGTEIVYDWLVISMGATANFRGIPGVVNNALPFSSYDDVKQIASALKELTSVDDRHPQVVIVGGGYAGVELAAAVVTKIRQLSKDKGATKAEKISVMLITDTDHILPTAPVSQRTAAAQELQKDGVILRTGYLVKSMTAEEGMSRMKSISLIPAPQSVNDQQPMEIKADLALWTAGNTPSTSSGNAHRAFPFEQTTFGALITEPTLRLVKQQRVFALGDDAFIQDVSNDGGKAHPLPSTAQVAFQQADYVAWNLWAAINKRPLLPFRYQHLGDMMSLGTQNAAIALPTTLPKPINDALQSTLFSPLRSFLGLELGEGESLKDQRATLEGPLAAFLRRIAYWYRQPTNEQKAKIAREYFSKVAQIISSRPRSNSTRSVN